MIKTILLFAAAIAATACHNVTAPEWTSGPDSDSDTDTDSDSDSDSDTDSDSDSDTDSDTDPPVVPVSFIVRNNTAFDRYLNWDWGGQNVIGCEHSTGSAAWETCRFEAAFCTVDCENIDEGDYCCMDCDYMPGVKLIPAYEQVVIEWNGTVAVADFDYCEDGCECYWYDPAPAGQFRASVMSYNDVDCWGDECEVQDDGTIWNGTVTGDPTDYSEEFENPHPLDFDGEIVIEITD